MSIPTEEPPMTERTGRCLCGDVHYRISADAITTRICWCRDCQRTAANGTVNMVVPTAAVEVSGATSEFVVKADSGNDVHRRFCARCGSHLFANSSARPQFTVVRVGTLDDPSSVRPVMNMWAGSAPAWACLDAALERVEHQAGAPQGPKPA
jgi:hypothetical protein